MQQRGESMAFVQYHKQPELRDPVVVAALAGWNDAADAATTAIKFLIDRWKPTKLAEIEPEEFYVFTETRPTIKFIEGIQRTIVWPTNEFLFFKAPYLNFDVILYLGVEPQLKWKTFSQSFLEVCRRFKVSEVLLLGALLADVPHSIAVPISGTSSNAEMMERLREMDVHSSRYEGPTGMIGVLQDACRRNDIPAASLWAAAPHYLAATPNIKVTSALLTYLNTFLSFGLDLSDIQTDAQRFEEQITALVARDPEASAYVRKLEEQVAGLIEEDEDDDEEDENDDEIAINPDRAAGTGPLPSADTLIRSVEELLRKERENNGHQESNDEG
jgi:proteasome assembly chaperone (PAC2) family protein